MRWMKIASVVLIALGLVHSLSFLTAEPPPLDPNDARMRELMAIPRGMMGVRRSTADLLRGFLISFSVFPIAMGIAAWAAASSDDRRTTRAVSGVFALALIVMTGVSVIWWFPAPTAFLAAAAVLFGLGWMQPGGRPGLHY